MVARERLIVIVGPTGVGKTEFALRLAEGLGAEIVSADSRQIYRYMDIGTAKPTLEERRRVRHHFIDIVDPDERYTAGDYGRGARQQIRMLFKLGKLPIVVGGSGLYIRALLDGLFSGPPSDPKIKKQLENEAKALGSPQLYQQLMQIDPQAAERIHPNDAQRIIRALEVFQITGERISHLQQQSPPDQLGFDPLIIGLTMERSRLYKRIEQRVETMIRDGLVEEVKSLVNMGYTRELNSLKTVGYKEIFPLLDGKVGLKETIEEIKKNSRRYAKRQLTWFRNDERVQWAENFDGNFPFEKLLPSFFS